MRTVGLIPLSLLAACGAPPFFARLPFEPEPSRYAPAPDKPIAVAAEERLAKPELTLDDVLLLVDAFNPELRATRLEIDIAGAEAWDAGLYPNPVLEIEAEEVPTDGGLGDGKRVAGIRQDLPLSGRLGAAQDAKQAERDAAVERFRAARRRILMLAKAGFYEQRAAARRLELLRRNAEIAASLHKLVQDRFDNRAAPETDLLKASIERALADQEVRIAERELDTAARALSATVGRTDLRLDRLSGELHEEYEAVSHDAVKGEVTAGHPALLAARADVRAAELGIRQARAEAWPDLGVAIRAGRGEADDTIVEAAIEIPLPIFNRNQAEIQAAELRAMRAAAHLDAATQEILLGLRRAWVNYESALDRVRTYREEILPKAEKALAQSDEGYRAGEFAFLTVLDSQRTLADTQLAYLAARLDVERAAAALEELIGRRLQAVR